MATDQMDDYGRVAFEKYSETKGGLTYDGKKIPEWSGLTDTVREAWMEAARAVIKKYFGA